MRRLAFNDSDVAETERALASYSPLEHGAFFLLRSGATASGYRFVASNPSFPAPGDWDLQAEHQLVPSALLVSAMVSRAKAAGAGLLFVHSHPDPRHPTAFSPTDEAALDALAPFFDDVLDGPFGAAVIGPDGWVARVWNGVEFEDIEHLTAAGRGLRFLQPLRAPAMSEMDSRQEPALGDIHHRFGACDVTLVGAGGIGSPLAETVFRMGPRSLTVFDSGFLDTASNVRRMFNTRLEQLVEPYPPKAQIAADACREIGLPNKVVAVTADVRFAATLPQLLDTDIIICATDSHSSRAALTAVAYAFHIPLLDGGGSSWPRAARPGGASRRSPISRTRPPLCVVHGDVGRLEGPRGEPPT